MEFFIDQPLSQIKILDTPLGYSACFGLSECIHGKGRAIKT